MRVLPLTAALGIALACARPAPPPPGGAAPPGLSLPDDARPLRYVLDLTLLPERDRFEGSVAIEVELARPLSRLWLHARELTVREAAVEAGGAVRPATFTPVTAEGVSRLAVATPIPAWAGTPTPGPGSVPARPGGPSPASTTPRCRRRSR